MIYLIILLQTMIDKTEQVINFFVKCPEGKRTVFCLNMDMGRQ